MARMTAFVFWTGIYNAGLALLLSFPPAYRPLGLHICDPLWGWLIASFLAFTSVVLILAARDLARRASFVYWESFLRYAAALLTIPAGLFGDTGLLAAGMGLGDLGIGLVYMFGLPPVFSVSHSDLLFDRLNLPSGDQHRLA